MTVADDLKAVRALLVQKGRARRMLTDNDGKVCLRQAMIETVGYKHIRSYHAEWVFKTPVPHQIIRDLEMQTALAKHVPAEYIFESADTAYILHMALTMFNDDTPHDEVILDLIDKALADLGEL